MSRVRRGTARPTFRVAPASPVQAVRHAPPPPIYQSDGTARSYCRKIKHNCEPKNSDIPKTEQPETRQPLYTVSLGCPKNLVDTEIMLGGLTNAGWEVTGEPAAADLLLVNTCGFIEPACKEAVDTILDLARLKAERPEVRLVVAGCLVQRYGPELAQDLPEVDLFIGVNDFPALPETSWPAPARRRRPACFIRPRLTPMPASRLATPPPRRIWPI